ncbi:unnamed protein product [Diabrotica balteata]|uniref:Uncharacterized protein n=1 Tax=Diabrotica balteata TaxID=107213 RepID=A0A9N9SRC8_DIABA|nr:unnamed protein product [Diabrotica balteata]
MKSLEAMVPIPDKRDKHTNRPNKHSEEHIQSVKTHIESIPKYQKSPAENEEEEEETEEGMMVSNKKRGSQTCIEIPRTDTTSMCLLEKPPIDKKVKVSNFYIID